MGTINNSFLKSTKLASYRNGILHSLMKLARQKSDPNSVNFGVYPCNTLKLNGEKYEGRSSGCNFKAYDAYMGTVGETIERYCPAFYRLENMIKSSYEKLEANAINPSEFALFHQKQYEFYKKQGYKIHPFTEDLELYWDECFDLTNGKKTFVPSAFIYLPWTIEDKWVVSGTSTGLAAHTHFHKAVLTALYEIIERDSFVLTWHQKIISPKIIHTKEIQDFIERVFPSTYEFHFFDITYDIRVPSIMGFCFGESEYGKFVAVGTATRWTYKEALEKVILEISQSVPYFRYMLGERKDWSPDEDYNKLLSFEDHSIFYLKRPELQFVFDDWKNAEATKYIDFSEEQKPIRPEEKIRRIVSKLKAKKYNVLIKDLTTPDANQIGFYCLRVIVPQLLQMGGAYPLYFLGGSRLYDVPEQMGYVSHSFEDLNKYPHPFP